MKTIYKSHPVVTGLSHVRCIGSGQPEHFSGNASAVAGRGSAEVWQLGFQVDLKNFFFDDRLES